MVASNLVSWKLKNIWIFLFEAEWWIFLFFPFLLHSFTSNQDPSQLSVLNGNGNHQKIAPQWKSTAARDEIQPVTEILNQYLLCIRE